MLDPTSEDIWSYSIQLPDWKDRSNFQDHLLHVAEDLRAINQPVEILDVVTSEEVDDDSLVWVTQVTYRT